MIIAIKLANGKVGSYFCPYDKKEISEEEIKAKGFQVFEYEGAVDDIPYLKLANGNIVLDTERKQADENRLASYEEIQTIQNWFSDYDRKVSEHSRCARLNTPCHHDIATLDAEAVIRAARLSALKTEARS